MTLPIYLEQFHAGEQSTMEFGFNQLETKCKAPECLYLGGKEFGPVLYPKEWVKFHEELKIKMICKPKLDFEIARATIQNYLVNRSTRDTKNVSHVIIQTTKSVVEIVKQFKKDYNG